MCTLASLLTLFPWFFLLLYMSFLVQFSRVFFLVVHTSISFFQLVKKMSHSGIAAFLFYDDTLKIMVWKTLTSFWHMLPSNLVHNTVIFWVWKKFRRKIFQKLNIYITRDIVVAELQSRFSVLISLILIGQK